MTNEEAIKILNEKYIGIGSNDLQVFQLARDALRRQIKRKPKIITMPYGLIASYYCPACSSYFGDRAVGHPIIFHTPDFCDHCGQAIDFRDTK